MTNDELNQYILHYLTEDKTNTAIMLTGDWGTGKSYYIQNTLKPYLEREENGNHQCIVVSLYGIKSTVEISKAIYLECRAKWLKPTTERKAAGKVAAKTVFKSLTSMLSIDLSKSDSEMQELYESIDLSGKLIVLEDLERSGIDIFEVLGYVNTMVEHDGVKVLLVANEEELIQYEPIKEKTRDQQKTAELIDKLSDHKDRKYTETTKKYLSIKEKTVSDTILFDGDLVNAIMKILSEFRKDSFSCFMAENEIEKIQMLLKNAEISNLRTFIYACQKTNDMFAFIKPNSQTEFDFMKTILYSVILFSNRLKTGEKPRWEGNKDFSLSLSSEEYPLFRFCYDYIIWHILDTEKIDRAKAALSKLRLYDRYKSLGDKDLKTLYGWWLYSEKDVSEAIESITKRLQNEADISFYEYGRIAIYIIGVKSILGIDIEETKRLLIKNLYNKSHEIDADYIFTMVLSEEEKQEVVKEFEDLKIKMTSSLEAKDTTLFEFDYQPEHISEFSTNVINNCGRIIRDGAFLARFDINRLIEMLKHCNANNIDDFRRAILSVYRDGSIRNYLRDDKDTIKQLLPMIEDLEKYEEFDKIQKMQIRFLVGNLTKVLTKLE